MRKFQKRPAVPPLTKATLSELEKGLSDSLSIDSREHDIQNKDFPSGKQG
jgi:hypothetical protein